jgi:hypothetical protein
MSKNWQRVTKRERERAVELKRTLKRERKQAERAARKNGTPELETELEPAGDEEPEAEGAVPNLETADAQRGTTL